MPDTPSPILTIIVGAIALAILIPMKQQSASNTGATYQTQAGKCDSAYPDFCIPPLPPDLDCSNIGRQNFTVRSPDPHRLDGDRDGIGCEPRGQ
jgi:Excalibur calcium-binding domain